MRIELIVFLVALVPLLSRAVLGWRTGATLELRHTLTYLFATLAALRFWKPVTDWGLGLFPSDPQMVGTIAFLAVFVLSALLAGLVVNLKGPFYQSVAPNPLDQGLGALAGLVSGALLGGVLVLLCAFLFPTKVPDFRTENLPARWDRLPVTVYQTAEALAGVAEGDAARTQFPVAPASEVPEKPATGPSGS